jgi:hypothetical protein
MNNKILKKLALWLLLFSLVVVASPVSAQSYSFSVDRQVVHAIWENDGTLSLHYEFYFTNYGDPMDYIDVGMPNANFDISNASAEINGQRITHIADSPYVENGIELGLGSNAIKSGQKGTVLFHITGIRDVLYIDSDDSNYASAVFSPTWFDPDLVNGSTDLTVIYHFPIEVKPEEPKWHQAPSGFPSEPETGFDDQGRITYTWRNTSANMSRQYKFGASFPAAYVPIAAVSTPTFWQNLGIDPEAIFGWVCICGIGLLFLAIPILSIRGAQKRKLKYLPPKLAIEGHGIKRGLTAIEAAILLEQPMDKILTMILFSTIKKGAAKVLSRDPLEIQVTDPLPDDLREYEKDFLAAMDQTGSAKRKRDLQTAMINLVKSVSRSMKGFSQRESRNYYKKIIDAAWQQVEDADTPEVKSETYDKVMEWTMLDNEYDERTKRVFQGYPVFLPMWWHNYNPRPFSAGTSASRKISAPTSSPTPGGTRMPTLPGAEFAGSIVTGVQDFATGVIGSVSSFTSTITNKTNPIPKVTSSGGSFRSGGGSSCACACACAGCACACAGGGR